MRYHEIVSESYKDDSNTSRALIAAADVNLSVGKFAAEQGQLVASFPLEYDDIVSIVRDYTKASTINTALLGKKPLSRKAQIQYDTLMDLRKLHYKLAEEHHVYSGTGRFDPSSLMENDLFETPTFISASLNIAVAAINNNYKRQDTTDHILHFILPKGYSGCFYIGPYSISPEELEMIIFPGEKFRVVGSQIRKVGAIDRHIYHLHPTR